MKIRREDFHDFGIVGDFLLVAAVEALDFQVGQQALNLVVCQLATPDAGGRTSLIRAGSSDAI
jgi:hypothetical protein